MLRGREGFAGRVRGRQSMKYRTTMPFGKHKGRSLTELPAEYLRWLLDGAKVQGPLRQSVLVTLNARPLSGKPTPPPKQKPKKGKRRRRSRDDSLLAEIRQMLEQVQWWCEQFRKGPGAEEFSLKSSLAGLNGMYPQVKLATLTKARQRYEVLLASYGFDAAGTAAVKAPEPSKDACDWCSQRLGGRKGWQHCLCHRCNSSLCLCVGCHTDWLMGDAGPSRCHPEPLEVRP
jgi:hypothetical protein